MSCKFHWIALIAIFWLNSAWADDPWHLTSEQRARCLSVLSEGMRVDDFWPAIHAAEGMTAAGQSQQVRQYLEPKLRDERDDQRRCGIARELVRAGAPRYSTELMKVLSSDNTHGHVHAAESLFKVGWSGEDKPLVDVLSSDRDIRLQIMAAAALARHGDDTSKSKSLALLRQVLREEPDAEIFRLAAWVLGRVGDPQDTEGVRSRLTDAQSDPLVTAFLQHALAALGDTQGRNALIRNFGSDNPAIRTYAAVFAGEIGMAETAPSLIQQLDDPSHDARIRAAHALILLDK